VPPEGLPTLKIKVDHHTDEWVDECTLAFHNEGEVAPPPVGAGVRSFAAAIAPCGIGGALALNTAVTPYGRCDNAARFLAKYLC
jgi:hypothetical protein